MRGLEEENYPLKRKCLVWLFAVTAACLTMTASAQVSLENKTPAANPNSQKYSVFAGFGYTSLNQVNQSRFGLIGGNVDLSRNWGRFFALTIDGGFYPTSYASGNPGNPSVSMILGGPELHGTLFENWMVYFRGMMGGEHTGGESITPRVSFAGGIGGGIQHDMGPHWAVRAGGDDIGSSFSLANNSPQLGYSPHRRWNARAHIGVAYRF
jgi:hypothetical protein